MNIRCITNENDFASLQNDWERLFTLTGTHFFSSFAWNHTWWKYFGKNYKLALLVAEEGQTIHAIAPLFLDGITVKYIGSGLADYGEFLGNPTAFPLFLAFIQKQDWLMNLRELPEASTTLQELAAALLKDHRASDVYFDNTCYFIDAKIPVDLKKKDIHRNENFLKRQGTLEYREIPHEEIHKLLPLFFQQHDAIWKQKKMPSTFQQKDNQAFLSDLITHTLGSATHFHALFLDNHMIAGDIGFLVGTTYTTYVNAYDIAWESKGPGMVLRRTYIQHYLSQGVSVDFSRGAENYKTRFANSTRTNMGIETYNSSGALLLGKTKHMLREYVMRHPRLHEKLLRYRASK